MSRNKRSSDIKVKSYSGYRADERPVSFVTDEKKLAIDRIIRQWRTPDAEYFKVQADDGNSYILKHGLEKDIWQLEKMF